MQTIFVKEYYSLRACPFLGNIFTQRSRFLVVYKSSFFPETVRDWNALPDSLISSAEIADDCVAKFTSLVRVRDLFPQPQVLVSYCQFGVSPVNYPDRVLVAINFQSW